MLFEELNIGENFRQYADSGIKYQKVNETEAKCINEGTNFGAIFGSGQVIFPDHKDT